MPYENADNDLFLILLGHLATGYPNQDMWKHMTYLDSRWKNMLTVISLTKTVSQQHWQIDWPTPNEAVSKVRKTFSSLMYHYWLLPSVFPVVPVVDPLSCFLFPVLSKSSHPPHPKFPISLTAICLTFLLHIINLCDFLFSLQYLHLNITYRLSYWFNTGSFNIHVPSLHHHKHTMKTLYVHIFNGKKHIN